MSLNFCPKCKGLIIPRNVKNETLLLCNQCGWFKIIKGKVILKEGDKIIQEPEKGKGIVNIKDSKQGFKHKCSKCGYNYAEVQDLGVQYSDEDTLILLKCKKCGNVERIGEAS